MIWYSLKHVLDENPAVLFLDLVLTKFCDSLKFSLVNFKISFIFSPKRYSDDLGSKSQRFQTSSFKEGFKRSLLSAERE